MAFQFSEEWAVAGMLPSPVGMVRWGGEASAAAAGVTYLVGDCDSCGETSF